MNIKELSVGDWVCAEQLCGVHSEPRLTPPMKVVGLGESWINLEIDPEQGDPFEFEPSEIRGVPITAEVLEKNGFVKKNYDNGKMWDWWCDNILVRKFADEDIYRFIVVFNSNHYTIMMVVGKHTHQFQHALRLAGIEKEIEL